MILIRFATLYGSYVRATVRQSRLGLPKRYTTLNVPVVDRCPAMSFGIHVRSVPSFVDFIPSTSPHRNILSFSNDTYLTCLSSLHLPIIYLRHTAHVAYMCCVSTCFSQQAIWIYVFWLYPPISASSFNVLNEANKFVCQDQPTYLNLHLDLDLAQFFRGNLLLQIHQSIFLQLLKVQTRD